MTTRKPSVNPQPQFSPTDALVGGDAAGTAFLVGMLGALDAPALAGDGLALLVLLGVAVATAVCLALCRGGSRV